MIFLILAEDAGKAFVKLRDRYVRAKRELKKNSRSGVSSASADKLKERLGSLKFWHESTTTPNQNQLGQIIVISRSARSIIVFFLLTMVKCWRYT